MAIAKGSQGVLLWKDESSFGVAPSGNWNQLPFNSETLDESINTIQGEDIRPDRANPALRGGNISTGGAVIQDFGFGRTFNWLRHLLGILSTDVTTGTVTPAALAASTAYKRGDYVTGETSHIWVCVQGGTSDAGEDSTDLPASTATGAIVTLATSGLRFMRVADSGTTINSAVMVPKSDGTFPTAGISLEKQIRGGDENLYLQYTGGRVNSLELTVPQENIVKANWNLLFKTATQLAATGGGTPIAPFSEDPFAGLQAWMHIGETAFEGSIVRPHREFSMTVTNQFAEDVYVIGSRYRLDLPEGIRKMSGRVSMYFQDKDEYTYFKNETEIQLGVSFIHQGNFIQIQIPEAKLTGSGTPKISGQGPVMSDFEWTGYKQDATDDIKVIYRGTTAYSGMPI